MEEDRQSSAAGSDDDEEGRPPDTKAGSDRDSQRPTAGRTASGRRIGNGRIEGPVVGRTERRRRPRDTPRDIQAPNR